MSYVLSVRQTYTTFLIEINLNYSFSTQFSKVTV